MLSNSPASRRGVAFACFLVVISILCGAVYWWQVHDHSVSDPIDLTTSDHLRELPRSALTLRDGRLYESSGTPSPDASLFSGVFYENFPSGERKLKIEVRNGKVDGTSVGYFENGKREVLEHFTNGVSNGLRTRWDTEGRKLSEEPIKNGKLNGTFVKWHPNGNKAVQMTMVNGEIDGVADAWHPDGTLKSKTTFADGKLINRQFFSIKNL